MYYLIKLIINNFLLKFGFVLQRYKHKKYHTLFEAAFTKICSNKPIIYVVQIGANDGIAGDPVFPVVNQFKNKTRLMLIEPQSDIFEILKTNYSDHPGAQMQNIAIGTKGKLILYRVTDKYKKYFTNRKGQQVNTSGWTSSGKEHLLRFISETKNIPARINISDVIDEISSPSMPLNDCLVNAGWPNKIDVLNVDTEGTDDFVIYHCSLEKYQPSLINFEDGFLNREKQNNLHQYLNSLGYIIFDDKNNHSLAIKMY
jgi:FkbM family methyltransferase